MNTFPSLSRLICLVVLMLAFPALAVDHPSLSGFGTLGMSCFTSRSADYAATFQPEGPGRSSGCDAGLDSLLGLQMDWKISESVDIRAQATANRNVDRGFAPELNVAQLRWKATDALTLRLGRSPNPSFLHSENRKVRYSMPWVRPPQEVYGLSALYSSDGVEAIYENQLGDWRAEWHGGVTRSSFSTPENNSKDTFRSDAVGGFSNLTLFGRNTLFKAGYTQGRASYGMGEMNILFDALRLYQGASGKALVNDLAVHDAAFHLLTFGARYEHDDWLLMGEFGYFTIGKFVRDQYGSYVTLGRQLGPWMPYVTLAKRWTRGRTTDSRAGLLRQPVEELLKSTRFDTSSVALGLSREVTDHATLKFQVDWVQPGKNSWGLYSNQSPAYNFDKPGSDWLFTLNVDFVF